MNPEWNIVSTRKGLAWEPETHISSDHSLCDFDLELESPVSKSARYWCPCSINLAPSSFQELASSQKNVPQPFHHEPKPVERRIFSGASLNVNTHFPFPIEDRLSNSRTFYLHCTGWEGAPSPLAHRNAVSGRIPVSWRPLMDGQSAFACVRMIDGPELTQEFVICSEWVRFWLGESVHFPRRDVAAVVKEWKDARNQVSAEKSLLCWARPVTHLPVPACSVPQLLGPEISFSCFVHGAPSSTIIFLGRRNSLRTRFPSKVGEDVCFTPDSVSPPALQFRGN
ncbi:uncharacterized protein BJX67DRAFT_249862 [Aspergillus lucknowensis]|uniref:Uncharacterized protein n=1 Tax=Aspergillus lucknowensis TaxID=176173 RepID=A0ABR4M1Z8_9EURO